MNSPQDDPAAFSEGVSLDSSIRGYTQAIRNLNDSVGLLNTAGGALGSQMEIVQKIREVAVQASNGTLSALDRSNLNLEVQSLLNEFRRIATSTQFNGINLLDGSLPNLGLQAGANANDNINFQLGQSTAPQIFQKQIGSGTFNNSTLSGGGGPAVADLNGDGNLDVVNSFAGTITVALGNGNGSFQQVQNLNAPNVFATAVGDVNGDGIQDISYVDSTGKLNILLGNGDGTFKPPSAVASGSTHSASLAMVDLNHDGKLDMVTTDGADQTISLFFGNGDGTFGPRITIGGFGMSPQSVTAADLNGDGTKDLVVGTGGTSLFTLIGNGDGTFQAPTANTVGNQAYSVQVGDLNGDGISDIVASSVASGNISILLGNGNGTFRAGATLNPGSGSQIALADLNGDGVSDIAAFLGFGNMKLFNGNGDGTFQNFHTVPLALGGSSAVAADFNKDGVPDLYVSFLPSQNSILLNQTITADAENDVNVLSQANAQKLLAIADNALNKLKTMSASVGADQDRLSFTLNQNSLLVQNLSDAKSSALSTDIAAETSNLIRNQILEQAQVAALGQENINSQYVLQLLKNL